LTLSFLSFTIKVIIDAGMKAKPIENINEAATPFAPDYYFLVLSVRGNGWTVT